MSQGKGIGKGKGSKTRDVPVGQDFPSMRREADTHSEVNLVQEFGCSIRRQLWFWNLLKGAVFLCSLRLAYSIRLFAVKNYGTVIHEFDPWFNLRATQYLADNGYEKFFKWFDYMSWYPLGRPVGTTIYPGMQFTAVFIWELLRNRNVAALCDAMASPFSILEGSMYNMSLNDVCVFIPAWFGAVATFFLSALVVECTQSSSAGVLAACVMAVIPAHIMRSVAGGFDNECIAIPAMCMTFFFWVRSLRGPSSWPFGILCGISYFYMVATWGGYVFVLNMLGIHAITLVFLGRFSKKLHHAFTCFYVVGTLGAIQVKPVGLKPLRSLEEMPTLGVFGILQVMYVCEIFRERLNIKGSRFQQIRFQVFAGVALVAAVAFAGLLHVGYIAPMSSRIRGLFVKHTKTGNPLVDSVAEHQKPSNQMYWHHLHYMYFLAPLGFVMTLVKRTDQSLFLTMYAFIAYHFSAKMNRLMLLLGPIAAALGGIAVDKIIRWCFDQFLGAEEDRSKNDDAGKLDEKVEPSKPQSGDRTSSADPSFKEDMTSLFEEVMAPMKEVYEENGILRQVGALLVLMGFFNFGFRFIAHCNHMAESMSHPLIMYKAKTPEGKVVVVDDYREAYWFLRDNTTEDSRIMAWWDYGYQITGIANRTTIADGNTWNHEHIATLGRALTSPEKRGWNIARHLADYVLVWTGGGGDDLAKSPHIARIGNSVYKDFCPGDPMCSQYSINRSSRKPSPMMEASLLYKLHSNNGQNVTVNASLFREVFTSTYKKVRIYQVLNVSLESKAWAADPKNRKCDAPGSWYCEGQYPPALDKLFEKKKAFKQLEDFNAESDKDAEEYQKQYHEKAKR